MSRSLSVQGKATETLWEMKKSKRKCYHFSFPVDQRNVATVRLDATRIKVGAINLNLETRPAADSTEQLRNVRCAASTNGSMAGDRPKAKLIASGSATMAERRHISNNPTMRSQKIKRADAVSVLLKFRTRIDGRNSLTFALRAATKSPSSSIECFQRVLLVFLSSLT